jgi:hypothetical protein
MAEVKTILCHFLNNTVLREMEKGNISRNMKKVKFTAPYYACSVKSVEYTSVCMG